MCHHPLRFAKDCVDFNMHEEIEEPEKATGTEEKKLPDGLEEAAKEYFKPEWSGSLIDAFIAGAEWGMNQCPLPEDTTIFQKGIAEGRRLEREEQK